MNFRFDIKLLLVALSLIFVGCSQDVQDNTSVLNMDFNDLDEITTPQQAYEKQNGDGNTLNKIFNELTIEKFKSEDQAKVNIPLPSGWGAIPTQYEGQYTIVNETGETIGEWSLVGQSPDHPNGYLPNHIVTQEKTTLQTKFGNGYIYQLELDLPDQERTTERSTYKMVYVLIPIEKMQQSYNFYVEIPFDQSMEKYVELIETMLRQ